MRKTGSTCISGGFYVDFNDPLPACSPPIVFNEKEFCGGKVGAFGLSDCWDGCVLKQSETRIVRLSLCGIEDNTDDKRLARAKSHGLQAVPRLVVCETQKYQSRSIANLHLNTNPKP